jgi:cytochrome c556
MPDVTTPHPVPLPEGEGQGEGLCAFRRLLSARAIFTGLMTGLLFAGAAVRAEDRALPPPADTIFARKTLMNTINSSMDEIEAMLAPGAKMESAEAREHADLISVLLMAFPHLFPPATNQWKEGADRDAAADTYASPDLWRQFPDFYARANAASKIALEASRAANRADFKARIGELRAACNGCHAAFQKTGQ